MLRYGIALWVVLPSVLQAQTVAPPPTPVAPIPVAPPPTPVVPVPVPLQAPPNQFAELSRVVQEMVVEKLPKEIDDKSNWGMTIPVPPRLPFPNLRTYVKIGDQIVVPHGLWRKAKIWLEDPARDLTLVIKDMQKHDDKTMRVFVDTTLRLQSIGDVQHWQKGLATLGFSAQATTTVLVMLEVDVALSLDVTKFPPDIQVEPKIASSKVEIREFEMFKPGQVLFGNSGEQLNQDIKGLMQQLVRQYEPKLKDKANEAIAQSLKDGKGKISAASLMKALTK